MVDRSRGATSLSGRRGVSRADTAFSDLEWAFREQAVADFGIDAVAEALEANETPTGKHLALQIKHGPSYFKSARPDGWIFTGKNKHLSYWLKHQLHVLVLLVHPTTKIIYWAHVTPDAIRYTPKAWTILVPNGNILGPDTDAELRRIAFSIPAAHTDPIDATLALLPASTVEMITAARKIDSDGTVRVAKALAGGRFEARDTAVNQVAALRAASGPAKGHLLAAVGAYANEHGYPDLATTTFGEAADELPEDRSRMLGIASLLAVAAGDRTLSTTLLEKATTSGHRTLMMVLAQCVLSAAPVDQAPELERALQDFPLEDVEAEPTCRLFLADAALRRGDLGHALATFRQATRRYPRMTGGRLGIARTLMEQMVTGRSVVPAKDRDEAVRLASEVRAEMIQWAGPSQVPLLILIQAHHLNGGFTEIVNLATPQIRGGEATEREAIVPEIAVYGAVAATALRDRERAAGFVSAAAGTPAEPIVRAIVADGQLDRAECVTLWRDALCTAGSPMQARICLTNLAGLGALTSGDIDTVDPVGHIDAVDRELFLARSNAAAGDVESALTVLRRLAVTLPKAAEILVEVLGNAGRLEEAIDECDIMRDRFGVPKASHDKINLLVRLNRRDEADALAHELLADPTTPRSYRDALRGALIESRVLKGDWPGVEREARRVLSETNEMNEPVAWWLIYAQMKQDRLDDAWGSYVALDPTLYSPECIFPWLDLHAHRGFTAESRAVAESFLQRWPDPVLEALVRPRLNDG